MTSADKKWLIGQLEGACADAKRRLNELHRSPEAWQTIEVVFDGPGSSPAFGGSPDQQQDALGPPYRVIRKRTRTDLELRAYRELQRKAREIAARRNVTTARACVLARKRHPALYEAYQKQRMDSGGAVEETAPWRAAKIAAVANAALHQLKNSRAVFAAAAYIEADREFEILRRILPATERKRFRALYGKDIRTGHKMNNATAEARKVKEATSFQRHQKAIELAKPYIASNPNYAARALARWLTKQGVAGDTHHFVRYAQKKKWL